jgi:hypothetical protein
MISRTARFQKQQQKKGSSMNPEVDTSKDKQLIWDDCPACAYKHLTAAYAALTMQVGPVKLVRPEKIYLARAIIAIREYQSGYVGNLALAQGCLAMAEVAEGVCPVSADSYRESRLRLTRGEIDTATCGLPAPGLTAVAYAHYVEALRELPALAEDKVDVANTVTDILYGVPDVLAMLRDQIRWVEANYELNQKVVGTV